MLTFFSNKVLAKVYSSSRDKNSERIPNISYHRTFLSHEIETRKGRQGEIPACLKTGILTCGLTGFIHKAGGLDISREFWENSMEDKCVITSSRWESVH
jgi:hypothetical protein